MKADVKPTQDPEQLAENLEKRVESVEVDGDSLNVELEDSELLERTPGIDSFEVDGEQRKGIGGVPVSEQVYARLESKEDAARLFLATLQGYDLRVLETERVWDLRQLRRFNPDIKQVKAEQPVEALGVDEALFETRVEGVEKAEVETPDREDLLKIYREKLT